jgi:hypothetical protein
MPFNTSRVALVMIIGWAVFVGACNGDQPKVNPDQRDVNRVMAAVSEVVYQCLAVEAGYTDRLESKSVGRDVDYLVDAWARLRPDAHFRTATGMTTLRRQSNVAARRLERGCAPRQADRLREAMQD